MYFTPSKNTLTLRVNPKQKCFFYGTAVKNLFWNLYFLRVFWTWVMGSTQIWITVMWRRVAPPLSQMQNRMSKQQNYIVHMRKTLKHNVSMFTVSNTMCSVNILCHNVATVTGKCCFIYVTYAVSHSWRSLSQSLALLACSVILLPNHAEDNWLTFIAKHWWRVIAALLHNIGSMII